MWSTSKHTFAGYLCSTTCGAPPNTFTCFLHSNTCGAPPNTHLPVTYVVPLVGDHQIHLPVSFICTVVTLEEHLQTHICLLPNTWGAQSKPITHDLLSLIIRKIIFKTVMPMLCLICLLGMLACPTASTGNRPPYQSGTSWQELIIDHQEYKMCNFIGGHGNIYKHRDCRAFWDSCVYTYSGIDRDFSPVFTHALRCIGSGAGSKLIKFRFISANFFRILPKLNS